MGYFGAKGTFGPTRLRAPMSAGRQSEVESGLREGRTDGGGRVADGGRVGAGRGRGTEKELFTLSPEGAGGRP